MTELPQLYTIREVAAAMKCSVDTVQRALRRHPAIRPIGRGRGLRLTLEDYRSLIEALRGPGPGYISPAPGVPMPHPGDKKALSRLRRQRMKEIVRSIRMK
jgi:DNA-binding transcriptional MocR family regulator